MKSNVNIKGVMYSICEPSGGLSAHESLNTSIAVTNGALSINATESGAQ